MCLFITMATLSVVTWNVRGVMNCLDRIKSKLDGCDALVISEHWLNDSNISPLLCLHDSFDVYYKCMSNHTSHRGAGGVALFVRKTLHSSVLHIPGRDNIVGAKLTVDGSKSFIIGTRLPSTNVLDSVYCEELYATFDIYDKCIQEGETILVGDFNADIRHRIVSRRRARLLYLALRERDVVSLIPLDDNDLFTYSNKAKTQRSLIDYVFIGFDLRSKVIGYAIDNDVSFDLSDHNPILAVFRIEKP